MQLPHSAFPQSQILESISLNFKYNSVSIYFGVGNTYAYFVLGQMPKFKPQQNYTCISTTSY
jgi:hypothetical protein